MSFEIDRATYYADLDYKPREWQAICDKALDEDGKRFVSAFSFPRGGKSYWAARYVGPRLLRPDHHVWIVAPTYELGSKEFLYVYNDLLQLGFLNMKGVTKSKDIRGGMHVSFPWGAFIKVVSADHPVSLRAEELDDVILAEASGLPADLFWNYLFIRVEKRHGNVLIPTTPKGFNWVYDSFRVPSLKTIHGEENPKYDDEFFSLVISADPDQVKPDEPDLADLYEPSVYDLKTVARAKRLLPAPIFIEQFGGGFASYAGNVFPYIPSVHRCKPFKIPEHWTHVIGWDHGALPSPTAILCFSYDEKGHTYWWGEILGNRPNTSAREYLSTLRAMVGNKRLTAVGIDPSAKQVSIELSKMGLTCSTSFDKSEMAGILRLTAMMNEQSMHVFEGCLPGFEHDLLNFQWDEKKEGKTRDSKRFHFIAAARYGSLIHVSLPAYAETAPPGQERIWQAAWREVNEKREEERSVGNVINEPDPWADLLANEEFDPFESEEWF